MAEAPNESSSRSEEEDAIGILQQTCGRAAELIAKLQRDRTDLESNTATDPAVKAEGLAALDQVIDAARRVMEDAQRSLEARLKSQ